MMDSKKPVVFYLRPNNVAEESIEDYLLTLRRRGFQAVVLSDFPSLCLALEEFEPEDGAVAVVWLSGNLRELILFAIQIRLTYPIMGLLMQTKMSDSAYLHALHNGADMVLPDNAHPELVVAALHSVVRRLVPASSLKALQKVTSWRLKQDGWALYTPQGESFALTAAERAFMRHLVASPERRASHKELLQAISFTPDDVTPRQHILTEINRLGVLVSRMRRKLSRSNVDLPIRSIHNWGYMFAAHCELDYD